jgi:hypothetical protein
MNTVQNDSPGGQPAETNATPEAEYAEVASYYAGRIDSSVEYLRAVLQQQPSEFRSGSRLKSLRLEAENIQIHVERLLERLAEIETNDLGECSRQGCSRPAIEGKSGYVGPLYCGPRCAFVDREARQAVAR